MASEKVKMMESADMTKDALEDKGVVFVDFWATWCGPCRMVAPIIDQLAEEYEGKLTIGKLDVDEQADAAMKYGVSSIPTMILFKDGVEMERIVGARNKAALEQVLDKYI